MSADLLRRAASLMRERAEADLTPGPWSIVSECPDGKHHHDWDEIHVVGSPFGHVAACGERYTSAPRDAEHIASWHPAVALAVADWLDHIARTHEVDETGTDWWTDCPCEDVKHALAVARAYLGEEA